MVATALGWWLLVTKPVRPWHDLTFKATGFGSQSLFLRSAGMKVVPLLPK